MKYSKVIPTDQTVLVVANDKQKLFRYYHIKPTPIGDLQWHGNKHWVAEDGYEFVTPESALKHYLAKGRGTTLEPGTYNADVRSVTQYPDRVVIVTEAGEIIINTKR